MGHGPWAMRQRLWATGYGSRAMEHGPRVMGHRPRDMGHAGFKDVGTGHAGFEDMTQPRTAGWARLSTCGAQKRPAFGRGGWSAKIQRFLCKRRRPTGHARLNRLRPRPLHDHETHGGSSGETRAWAGGPGGPHSASRLAARFLLALSPFPVEWANGAHPSQSRGPRDSMRTMSHDAELGRNIRSEREADLEADLRDAVSGRQEDGTPQRARDTGAGLPSRHTGVASEPGVRLLWDPLGKARRPFPCPLGACGGGLLLTVGVSRLLSG